MTENVMRLVPDVREFPNVSGLYLDEIKLDSNAPFLYSNFVSSLDGRIAIPDPLRATRSVPPAITNADDWRLFQELAAQADVVVTSARYFRQALIGESQDHLPLGPEQKFDDLRRWRESHHMSPQPAIAILSASLEIPVESLDPYLDRGVHVLTTGNAPEKHETRLRAAGAQVHRIGDGNRVDGNAIRQRLYALGYTRQYAIGGPEVLHTLLQAGVLDRLYLTFAFQILAGDDFDSICRGQLLAPAAGATLRSLYLCGRQMFCSFAINNEAAQ